MRTRPGASQDRPHGSRRARPGHRLVGGEERGGPLGRCQRSRGDPAGVGPVVPRTQDELLRDRQLGLTQGDRPADLPKGAREAVLEMRVPVEQLGGRYRGGRLDHDRDSSMPQAHEVLHRVANGHGVVDHHHVASDVGGGAVEQHDRDASILCLLQVRRVERVRGYHDHAVHPLVHHHADGSRSAASCSSVFARRTSNPASWAVSLMPRTA